MVRSLMAAAALGLALTSPGHAYSCIPNVPSLWPAEGAFKGKVTQPETATRALISDIGAERMVPEGANR